MTAPSPRAATARLHGRLALLYFASGMPNAVVLDAVQQYLAQSGAALADVARIPTRANLAWFVKFLWAPAVDATRRRRPWIVGAMAALAALFGSVWLGVEGAGSWAFAAAVVGMAVASATLDLGADGWAIDRVPKQDLGPASAVRTAAYRIGMAAGAGGLAKIAAGFGWPAAFGVAGGVYLLFAVSTLSLREDPRPRAAGPPLLPALADLWGRPGFLPFLTFVFLFKLGDHALGVLMRAFQVDVGLPGSEIADLAFLGIAATVAGAALGGMATRRLGPFRALWILGLLQAGSNLAFAWAAAERSRGAVYAAALVEPFCGGLGTAPFVSWLMAACNPRYAATQFAILTAAAIALGKFVVGEFAGPLVEAYGYAAYFGFTFLLALPAYALLPWVPREGRPLDDDRGR